MQLDHNKPSKPKREGEEVWKSPKLDCVICEWSLSEIVTNHDRLVSKSNKTYNGTTVLPKRKKLMPQTFYVCVEEKERKKES